jgi:MEDS: MEthanogen/methylotroph, DcmR Sensory domain
VARAEETYLSAGNLDPDRMLATLREQIATALAEGSPGVRVAGEMSWALRVP